jgi:hypothetical protein
MTEETAVTELTTDVKLAALMPALNKHAELNLKELQEIAAQSDAAQQRSDYGPAIEAAQSFLAGLVKGITEELLRPPGESAGVFRARELPARNIGKCGRFLEHKRFLRTAEKVNIELALAAAVVPAADNGMSLETWSRVSRHIVFATAGRTIARYRQWQAGCSCAGVHSFELILFQPIGGEPVYEQAICRQYRCPRQDKPRP